MRYKIKMQPISILLIIGTIVAFYLTFYSVVAAADCSLIENQIKNLQTMTVDTSGVVLTPEQQSQIDAISTKYDALVHTQDIKNQANLDWFMSHNKQPNPGNQWNPGSSAPLVLWNASHDKLISNGESLVSDLRKQQGQEMMEAKQDFIKINSDALSAKLVSDNETQIAQLQLRLQECKTPAKENVVVPAIVKNEKPVVTVKSIPKENTSGIIIASPNLIPATNTTSVEIESTNWFSRTWNKFLILIHIRNAKSTNSNSLNQSVEQIYETMH